MARHDKQCNFRIANESVEWLKEQAIKNRRTLTTQLNWLIEQAKEKEQQHANNA